MSIYFYGACPKCNKTSKLVIASWNELVSKFHIGNELVQENSHTVSLSVYCDDDNCNKTSSGILSYDSDGPDMGPINNYANSTGDISESLRNILENIVYDVPPMKPISDLLVKAEKAFEVRLWDACVFYCRKNIDIQTKKMWQEKHPEKKLPDNLKDRINALFPEIDEKTGKAIVYHRAHAIRLDGNSAAHEDEHFNKKDAMESLSFTEYFLMNC